MRQDLVVLYKENDIALSIVQGIVVTAYAVNWNEVYQILNHQGAHTAIETPVVIPSTASGSFRIELDFP